MKTREQALRLARIWGYHEDPDEHFRNLSDHLLTRWDADGAYMRGVKNRLAGEPCECGDPHTPARGPGSSEVATAATSGPGPSREPSPEPTGYISTLQYDGIHRPIHDQELLDLASYIKVVVRASVGELPDDVVRHLTAFRSRILKRHQQEAE